MTVTARPAAKAGRGFAERYPSFAEAMEGGARGFVLAAQVSRVGPQVDVRPGHHFIGSAQFPGSAWSFPAN